MGHLNRTSIASRSALMTNAKAMGRRSLAVAVIASLVLALQPSPVRALDKAAALCQQAIGKGGQKFKKAKLNAWQKCLDGILTGKGCDAVLRDQKIATAAAKFGDAATAKCNASLLFDAAPTGVGFAQTCAFESSALEPAEAACAALPVTDPASLAQCLMCWKEAEIDELLQILYPCLAAQIPAGSDLDCGTPPAACPPPTDKGAVLCLRAIAKAGIKFFLAKEKALEQCLDAVAKEKIPGPCPDAIAQGKIAAAETAKIAAIQKCTALPPWWDVCPEDSTPPCDQTIASIGDVTTCVDNAADGIAAEVVCQQYPGAAALGIACPPAEPTPTPTPTTTTTPTPTATATPPPCGSNQFPTCNGTCPSGQECLADWQFGLCWCADPAHPPCYSITNNQCYIGSCIPGSGMACGSASAGVCMCF